MMTENKVIDSKMDNSSRNCKIVPTQKCGTSFKPQLFCVGTMLAHEEPEQPVSFLVGHTFTNARKMLWSCEG